MLALTLGLIGLALLGHAAFWVGLVNRWHSTGYSRAVVKSVTLLFYLGLVSIPLAYAWQWLERGLPSPASWPRRLDLASAYLVFSAAYGAAHLPLWALGRWAGRRLPPSVRIERTRVVDIQETLGYGPSQGARAALMLKIPGNQLWQLHVSEATVQLPRLPERLDGLSICHWSDLHLSGRIDRPYFHEIVRLTNEMQVDLIALTGDICDKAHTIDWIPEILGPARCRLGKFFIMGNHDLRTRDVERLRGAMREAGFVDLGGRYETLAEEGIVLAGNERPWFDAVPDTAELASQADALKILLAHSPDQVTWARRHGFDLMLAGHTHGGQIRFPLIGPVICPSWHGTRYAGGYFDEPPTLMHVSRGTASLLPLRINCPPDLTKIVVRTARTGE